MLEICALKSKDLSHYGLCKCSTVGDWTRAGMDENITIIASSKPGGKKKVIFKSKDPDHERADTHMDIFF
jgi:hypothetical protein